MRFWAPIAAVVLACASTTIASAEPAPVHLSIGLTALEASAPATASSRRIKLGLHGVPAFFAASRTGADGPGSDGSLVLEPEWRRVQHMVRERVSLRLEGFTPVPAPLTTVDEATRQIESLDVVGITGVLPILEPVRVLTNVITQQANQLIARGMSVAVGDRVDSRYTPLRGLAGDIQRGQYLRADDVTGRQFNFDVRLVLAWRANDRVRIEAGYAVAYLTGDGRTDFGASGPIGDRSTNYLVHGPCAAFNFDF